MPDSLKRYTLREADFDALAAGYETADAAEVLEAALCAYRQYEVENVIRLHLTVESDPETINLRGLDPIKDGLTRTWMKAPAVYRELLTHPSVGLWLAHVRRQNEAYRGYRTDGSNKTYFQEYPTHLDTHVQFLGSVAASAVMRAGFPRHYTLEVPIYGDEVILPTLGSLRLPPAGKDDWMPIAKIKISVDKGTRLFARGQEFELNDLKTPTAYWEPCNLWEVGEDPLKWRIILDDQDPYGSFEKPRPEGKDARLTTAERDHWQAMIQEAWNILATDHPQMAEEVARLRSIIPVKPWRQRFLQLSSSNPENVLSALLSLPENPLQLALGLVHEYAHTKLNKLLGMFKFYKPDRPMENNRRLYSAWRSDPRPLEGQTHGTFASMCMGEFWQQRLHLGSEKEKRLAMFEFAYWREVLPDALAQLEQRADEYTALGQRFLRGMSETITSWQNESIPPDIAYLARVTALSHAGQWRAHHLVPLADDIDGLARSWPYVETKVHINNKVGYLGAIGLLARFMLDCPEEFATAYKEQTVQNVILDATLADAAFMAGDLEKARQLYIRQLEKDPDDPASIVGLGLTEAQLRPSSVVDMLVHFPHVVRALNKNTIEQTGQRPSPFHNAAILSARALQLQGKIRLLPR